LVCSLGKYILYMIVGVYIEKPKHITLRPSFRPVASIQKCENSNAGHADKYTLLLAIRAEGSIGHWRPFRRPHTQLGG